MRSSCDFESWAFRVGWKKSEDKSWRRFNMRYKSCSAYLDLVYAEVYLVIRSCVTIWIEYFLLCTLNWISYFLI